ncbi:hypothetical protein J8J27_23560, partial [Mycobacterium tuberculosis]|nr:hypothetical protein [Mycobacterium tuberculosis]
LQAARRPVLICQGERDTFGGRAELAEIALPAAVQLHWIDDGSHDFGPRGRSEATLAGNIAAAVLWGGIAIAPAVALYLALSAFPRITDVSTDTVDPPLYKVAPFERRAGMNRAGFPDPAQLALQR